MQYYDITGMSCAACSARIEKVVSKLDGVKSCSVNLLTNSMSVEGNVAPEKIISAVEKAGYGATPKGSQTKNEKSDKPERIKDTETSKMKKRLFFSLAFLIVLMYFSMGHMMFGFPLPPFFEGNHVAMGLIQLILTVIIMVINQKFFVSGFKSLIRGAPNMDALVAIGSATAFVYSTVSLFLMTDAVKNGNNDLAVKYMDEFYFESSAMILTLITLGKLLESYSKGKTTNALKSLIGLKPKTAIVIENGKEVSVPIEKIKIGDVFVVRPGQAVPVDGIVISGFGTVDESMLTGESAQADKSENSAVYSGTINSYGFLTCKATKVGEDTTLSQIIKTVEEVSAKKAPIAKIADKVSGVFVPAVIAISFITVIVWLIVGKTVGFALARGISVLVISCPCALGLATPVAIMVGSGVGAKHGILFKTAESLEKTGEAKIVVLDKTGTITEGKPSVTDVIPVNGFTENELLSFAYALEAKSEHPLSIAIKRKAEELKLELKDVEDFQVLPGNGLIASLFSKRLVGGNYDYVRAEATIPDSLKRSEDNLSRQGKTPLYFAYDGKTLGIIAVSDTLKADSVSAVKRLKKAGLKVVMLTGDNQNTANAIGKAVGVDKVVAGVMPDGKQKVIEELKKDGPVIMVGDGINDALALTAADIGIAIGAGSDIAIDSCDVVLMKNRLSDVSTAIKLSKKTLLNVKENLFWAFFYNSIGIPLAAGVFINLFGLQLNPMFGAAAMSLSSFCVVTNALRLNLFKPDKFQTEQTNIVELNDEANKEVKMNKTIYIEGMMCGHCEAHVKKALENVDGVASVTADHLKGVATVTLSKEVSDDDLTKAVTAEGYKVTAVK